MNPEFGFQPQVPVGTGTVTGGMPGNDLLQNSNILIVTKIGGGSFVPGHVPFAIPHNMAMAPGGGDGIGWSDPSQQQQQQHGVAPPIGGPIPSFGTTTSQYAVRNEQNMEVAKIEPFGNSLELRGTSGEPLLRFAVEMTQMTQQFEQPPLLIRVPGTNQVLGALAPELKQSKDKHKEKESKPKKDKKKDKPEKEHKDKQGKDGKLQYVLRDHVAQPLLRFTGKQKAKEGGKLEIKIKSCASKDDGNGEVESVAGGGFQIRFKSSHGHGQSANPYLKSLILASVIGIVDLIPSSAGHVMQNVGPPPIM